MMPALPGSYFISKQMEKYIQGKKIVNIVSLEYVQPKYDSSDFFINLDRLMGKTVVKANSNFIITDNEWLCEFGYASNCLRYFETDTNYDIKVAKSNKTGFFKVKFLFDDSSCLYFVYSGWCSRFNIRPVNPPLYAYPFRSKFPLDVIDHNDFTLENLKTWLSDKGNWNAIETLVLARGATDIPTSHMNYLFWHCGIHPKTKTGNLSEKDIVNLYNEIKHYIDKYISGQMTCDYTDIFGIFHEGNDNKIAFNKENCFNKPCNQCGTSFESVSVGGTKAYFCPSCQKSKNR